MPERRHFNWTLLASGILLACVLLAAVAGPSLAPADPLQENYIGQTAAGKFIKPPFAPGAIEGFPLGSDEWGRDLLSRLLWGIRPTLTLVAVVAAVRLILGILAGLYTGWSSRRAARVVDGLLSLGLAAPVLIVALAVIAALGNRWGFWAFIAGLTVTGWAETARMVREQTRLVRSQPFVEAARSLGAAPDQLVIDHILPHILPLMWIQLAFEVSSALLTLASLGFLGYYINAVWIPIGDFTGLRATGYPELGQMLGVSVTYRQPWAALFAGAVLVTLILSANLVGEGLRMELAPERRRARANAPGATAWLENRVYTAAAGGGRRLSAGVVVVLVALVLGGTWALWQAQAGPQSAPQVEVPGGHWWASEGHDAQGTYWTPAVGPERPDPLWTYEAGGPLVGGPAIDANGDLYVNAGDRQVIALTAQGGLRWRADLPAQPVGAPAVTPAGDILAADQEGNLTCLTALGERRWSVRHQSDAAGALSGPVVAADGTAYYPTNSSLLAVYADGSLRWRINLPTYSITNPLPKLTRDDRFLFFERFVIDAAGGQTLFKDTPGPMDTYLVGSDGKSYLRTAEGVLEWVPTESGATLVKRSSLDTRTLLLDFRRVAESGVSPGGNLWFWFGSQYETPRFVWTDSRGQTPVILNPPFRRAVLVGIDQAGQVYLCGEGGNLGSACLSAGVQSGEVNWQTPLQGAAVGGAIAPGRFYYVDGAGFVVAVGQ